MDLFVGGQFSQDRAQETLEAARFFCSVV